MRYIFILLACSTSFISNATDWEKIKGTDCYRFHERGQLPIIKCDSYDDAGGGYDPNEKYSSETNHTPTENINNSNKLTTAEDSDTPHTISTGGYDPVEKTSIVDEKKLTLEKDLVAPDGIYSIRHPYNLVLDKTASNYLNEDESSSFCNDYDKSVLVEEINRPTNKFFEFLSNNIEDKKTDFSVTVNNNETISVEIQNQTKHEIQRSEIMARFKHFKKTKTIPIIEVEIDECHEYQFDDYFADLNNSSGNGYAWNIESGEPIYKVSGNQKYETREKEISIDYDHVNAKDLTEITIECDSPNCYSPWKRVLALDLTEEKKRHDSLITWQKEEAERERLRVELEARKEAQRLKDQEVEWERYKQKMIRQSIKEEEEYIPPAITPSRQARTPHRSEPDIRGDDSEEDRVCQKYGFKVGNSDYKQCRMNLDIAKQQAEAQQRVYDEQVRQYNQQKVEYEARVEQAKKDKEAKDMFNLLMYGINRAGGKTHDEAAPALYGLPAYPSQPQAPVQPVPLEPIGGRTMDCHWDVWRKVYRCQ